MAPPLQAGDRLGPYELVAPLGTGGTGQVWEAWRLGPAGFRKPLALKILRPDRADDPVVGALLVREARLGARVQHPNVVSTWDVSEHGGRWVIAMDLVPGASLEEVMRAGGPLAGRALLDLGLQLVAGIGHLHEAGLVHRDVKPANVLLDRSGFARLADLGISVAVGRAAPPAGTPGYVPPESGPADPRADWFALGVLLYVAATGRRPFPRETRGADALARALSAPAFRRDLDRAVAGLSGPVGACLSPDPDGRPSDADTLAAALAALVPDQPVGPTLAARVARARPGDPSRDRPPPPGVRPPRDAFVGREALQDEVTAALARGALVLLHGPGGVGKTRLAQEIATRWGGDVVWVDLTEAASEDDVVGAVAGALGIPVGGDAPASRLGDALAARTGALLVLDNLEGCVAALPATLGQWRRRAPGTAWLATSRVVTRLPGERRVAVGGLSTAAAMALLEDRLGRALGPTERAGAERLATRLSGWPLALELAAARARTGDVLGAPGRRRSLAASLDRSVALLHPDARRALRLLGVFEGSFDWPAAAAVLGIERGQALALTNALAEASLLGFDPVEERFHWQPIVREHAARAASPPEWAEAELRHARWYAAHGSDAAVRALDRLGGARRWHALALDRENLISAVRRAVRHGDGAAAVGALRAVAAIAERRGDPLLAGLAARVDAMPGLSDEARSHVARVEATAAIRAGRTEVAVERAEAAAVLARRAGAFRTETAALDVVAWLLLARGRGAEAAARYEALLARWRALGDRAREGLALLGTGRAAHDLERFDEARAAFATALSVLDEVGHDRGRALCWAALGRTLVASVAYDEADDALRRALDLHAALGDESGEANVHANRGYLAGRRERPREAQEHLRCALALQERIGDRRAAATTLGALGAAAANLGDPEAARGLLERAVALHREVGSPLGEAAAATDLARVLLQLGEGGEARRWCAVAAEHGQRTGARRPWWTARVLLAWADRLDGDWGSAEAGFRAARDAATAPEARALALFASAALVELLVARRRDAEAEALLGPAIALAEEVRSPPALAELLGRRAVVAARAGDVATARDALDRCRRALDGVEEPAERLRASLREAEVDAWAGDPCAPERLRALGLSPWRDLEREREAALARLRAGRAP